MPVPTTTPAARTAITSRITSHRIELRRDSRQFAEMRDDAVRAIFRHRAVGIAEIDRDAGHARRARGGDVGL